MILREQFVRMAHGEIPEIMKTWSRDTSINPIWPCILQVPSLKLTWPLKMGHPKRKLVFQPSIFRCYFTFREGTSLLLVFPGSLLNVHHPFETGMQMSLTRGTLKASGFPEKYGSHSLWSCTLTCTTLLNYIFLGHSSGQIITTSAEVTLNGGLVRELPQNPLNSGLGIILICPDSRLKPVGILDCASSRKDSYRWFDPPYLGKNKHFLLTHMGLAGWLNHHLVYMYMYIHNKH